MCGAHPVTDTCKPTLIRDTGRAMFDLRRRRWSAGGEGAEEAGEGTGFESVGPAAVGGDDGRAELGRIRGHLTQSKTGIRNKSGPKFASRKAGEEQSVFSPYAVG